MADGNKSTGGLFITLAALVTLAIFCGLVAQAGCARCEWSGQIVCGWLD